MVAVSARSRATNRINRLGSALAAALCLVATAAVPAAAAGPAHWPALPGKPVARTAALTKPTWLAGVHITEYYPTPESSFVGRRVTAPGLSSPHRVDWLYSAVGVTMEGTGIGLDGRYYHVDRLGFGGWVDKLGRPAPIGGSLGVYWRAGGFWRNAKGQLTFPLEVGGWSNGTGTRFVPLRGVSFAPGPGRPGLTFYRTLAVDPRLIRMGSRVYIPAYSDRGGGWFVAGDTGGAIIGRHVDVYRPPPRNGERVTSLVNQRILVVPPGTQAPAVPVSATGGGGGGGGGGEGKPPKGGGGGGTTGGTAP